ncbi:MAG: hypothetical protein Q9204_003383 [Flavoplaca sp. TL-2023a]
MSDGSSTNSSRVLLTPSETVATPSATLLDISQQGCEGLGASNSPLSELGVSDAALPMELDTNHMPDVTLPFQQPYVDENTYQHVGYQTGWTTNDGEYTGFQYAGGSLPQPINRAQSFSDDMDLAMNLEFFDNHTHRMLAAFNQAFPPEEQNHPTIQSIDKPRYVPWPPGLPLPWSPEVLNWEHIERSPGPQKLLYEPAMDFYPQSQALRRGPENNIDPPPPPDPVGPPTQMVDRNGRLSGKTANAGRGGRRHQPLNSHSRQNAKIIRQAQGQCWSCILQRNPCHFKTKLDVICAGCTKKRMPSLLPICLRIRLQELTRDFIPASLADLRDTMRLRAFARARIHCWLDNHFEVCIMWAHEFRPIKVGVTEIEPEGTSLLLQNQYRLNLLTNQYDLFQAPSPPLGIQLMFVREWRVRLDGYLEEIIRGSFGRFPAICFRGDECRVEKDFLIPIFNYHEAVTGREKALVHQALKLVLLTFIMTHSLTIVEDTKEFVYKQLRNKPKNPFGNHTCARLLNKQIKYLLSTLHEDVLRDVLNRVQDTLRHSKRKDLWAPLFASIVILAMTIESLEVTVRCKAETDKQEGTIDQDDRKADEEIARMDDRFDLLRRLFHQGYRTLLPKGFNPLRDLTDRSQLVDNASRTLAAKAGNIVMQYYDFLVARQVLGPPTTTSNPQTARLIAQFLLCFSPPVEQNQPQPAVAASAQ